MYEIFGSRHTNEHNIILTLDTNGDTKITTYDILGEQTLGEQGWSIVSLCRTGEMLVQSTAKNHVIYSDTGNLYLILSHG